jgi:hypothetical protein
VSAESPGGAIESEEDEILEMGTVVEVSKGRGLKFPSWGRFGRRRRTPAEHGEDILPAALDSSASPPAPGIPADHIFGFGAPPLGGLPPVQPQGLDLSGFMEPQQPPGQFQSYSDGLDDLTPDLPALGYAAPASPLLLEESPAPKPAAKMKRATEPGELEGISPGAQQEADGDGRRKKAKKAKRGPPDDASPRDAGAKKFACPYFKRNPKKYRKWTSCPGPGWDEVHRVKTHLYRRHPLPTQCPRCWEPFKADAPLQEHLQQDPPCAVRSNRTLQEGFTKDQEKKLRSRKKTHADMTDEDKWREIYLILFPDDDQSTVPSPCECFPRPPGPAADADLDYSEEDAQGERGQPSGELEDYATFVRREMPTLVRRELEVLFQDEFQDVEDHLRPRVAEIVLSLQPRLLGLYRQSQLPLSEYGPEQHRGSASGSELASTPLLSPGTGPGAPDSTPDTVLGVDGLVPGAEPPLGFYDPGLDAAWSALYPGTYAQTQITAGDADLGVNWEFEFDRLLDVSQKGGLQGAGWGWGIPLGGAN